MQVVLCFNKAFRFKKIYFLNLLYKMYIPNIHYSSFLYSKQKKNGKTKKTVIVKYCCNFK